MGDAGYILAGPVGREVLAFGTVVFAVFATGMLLTQTWDQPVYCFVDFNNLFR